jgi:hypothetical protein
VSCYTKGKNSTVIVVTIFAKKNFASVKLLLLAGKNLAGKIWREIIGGKLLLFNLVVPFCLLSCIYTMAKIALS